MLIINATPADSLNLSQVILFFFIFFSVSSFEPRPVLHAYRSSASRYRTVSLRSFSGRRLGCTHLFFPLEAAGIRMHPEEKSAPFFFLLRLQYHRRIYYLQYATRFSQNSTNTVMICVIHYQHNNDIRNTLPIFPVKQTRICPFSDDSLRT